jgi:hypothetical protein
VFLEEVAGEQADLDTAEGYWMSRYDSRSLTNGYNLKEAGSYGLHSPETKKKISRINGGKPFVCVETGVTYQTQGAAAADLQVHDAGISRALHDSGRRAGGFSFKYLDGSTPCRVRDPFAFSIKMSRSHGGRPIICTENGMIYQTQYAAAAELGLLQGSVSAVLRGLQHHTGGYHFKYVEE